MTDADETRESFGWWFDNLTPQERAERVVKCERLIRDLPAESYRRDRDLFNVRLYENNPVITLYNYAGAFYADASTMSLPVPEQSTNNRAKAAIDTLASQIFSTNQRARFLVVDGNYRQRRRARELQTFTDGLVLELKLHALRKRAGMDASILESGVGCITFYRKDGRCAAERALATEFSISPRDGLINGQPRTLYRHRPMPRDVMEADCKGDEAALAAIKAAPRVTTGEPGDDIDVYEAWHLPSGEGTDDGWHVMAVDAPDGCIVAEKYDKPFHETVFFPLEGKFTTAWGLSLMTQARKLQCRINANDYRSERITKLFASGHLYLNKASNVKKSSLTNEIGSVWEGNAPMAEAMGYLQFQGATADIEAKIERDGQRIFENLGVNQAMSQATTDSSIDASGAAKREDKATSGQRNAERQQRWEQFHIDCVRVALSIVRDCVTKTDAGKDRKKAKSAGSYKVATPGRRGLTITDWKDVAIDEKDYILEIKPANPIPTEPAGLVAFGQQMIELGAWKPERLAGYLQDLDADGRTNRQMSAERNLEKTYEALLYDKAAAAMPDEFTNYSLALEIGTEYLEQGKEDGVPEKHLERVRRYMKKCKALAKAAAAAMQPPPAPSAAPPIAGSPSGGPVNGPAAIAA